MKNSAPVRRSLGVVTAVLLLSGATALGPAHAAPASGGGQPAPSKRAVAVGSGGAVASVDPDATAAGLKVLREGGTAADAAVATAGALGVTEPYSAGVGGGGYFVYYDARKRTVSTIDGRETAPAGMQHDAFIDPETGKTYPFSPERVTSGVSVGVPGTPATWQRALERWGKRSLKRNLQPAIDLASSGFVIDETFRNQTLDNKDRFAAFTSTSALYLPGGDAPTVGSRFKNPDLAATYRLLADKGVSAFYRGPLAREVARTVQEPPKDPSTTLPVPVGSMTTSDLANYRTVDREPSKVDYRSVTVYGMAPSSSGGLSVGEALNILETQDLSAIPRDEALHYYLDASALAFADRGAYIGDPAFTDVPQVQLQSDQFAASRACLLKPDQALKTPTGPGSLDGKGCTSNAVQSFEDNGTSTTHLVASDRWGNVASYTLTNEQTGGSGIVVPGRGFLLNNELTDFSAVWKADDPNRIEAGKRPRSSMAPTIVLRDGRPFLALGSPGGATIITTVLQTLVNRIDFGMTLPKAIAAPRASHRNSATVPAEPEFLERWESKLKPYGYQLVPSGDQFTSEAEIGAVAALEFRSSKTVVAAAEPTRRGGGAAGVVRPDGR